MKLLIISPVFYTFWNYTTYAFIGAILAIVIIDLITRVLREEPPSESNYEGIKEIFNNSNSKDYIETKVNVTKLEVVPAERSSLLFCEQVNISLFSYRDLQAIAKALGIAGRNRKRLILEKELLAVCK